MEEKTLTFDDPKPRPEDELQQIENEVSPVITTEKEITIDSPVRYESAADFLKEIKAAQKKVTEFFGPMKSKAHAAWKEVVASENNVLNPLKKAEASIKEKLLSYDAEERRKAEEEQLRLQKIVDAKAEAERQRQIKAAEKLKTPELREERLAEAEEIEAPVVHLQHDVPKVAGVSTRTVWKARITNKADFVHASMKDLNLLGFITINQTQLDRLAQATKGELNYPGIEFYSSQVMAAGGK